MEGFLEDFFGRFSGDFFDFHAALGGGDHGGCAAGAVDGDAEIIFAGDIDAGCDEEDGDGDAFGAGLIADHAVGEHEFGGFAGFIGGFDELDEPGLSAAAGVDLGFDDADGGLHFFEGFSGGFGGADDFGLGDGDGLV